MSQVFGVAGPHVVGDEVDGEVIVINLDNGAYFSFRDSASMLWQILLEAPATLDQLVSHLGERYRAEPDVIRASVAAFVRSIEAEGLVAPSIEPAREDSSPTDPAPAGDLPEFSVPTFEKYTEMEEFLLVDPIHEIDVTKWPTVSKRDEGEA